MNKKGVTLIELVIVVSIIGVLVLLAIPEIKANKLSGAARMIFSDLHYARMQAIKEKNNFRMIFHDDGATYQIHSDRNNNAQIDEGEKVISKNINNDFHNITFTANHNPTFNPVGTGNSGTITLSDQSASKYIIFSWTGRIRISDISP